MKMKLSLIAAVSDNGIVGSGLDIPWQAKGEQLLFVSGGGEIYKAMLPMVTTVHLSRIH